MGCCGSTTTTSTKTAPLSGRGRSYESLFSGMMMANLDQQGYNVRPEEKTEWSDPAAAAGFEKQIGDINTRIADIDRQIKGRGAYTPEAYDPLTMQRQNLMNELSGIQKKYDKLEKTTYTDYKIDKKPDPRVQAIREKYTPKNMTPAQAIQWRMSAEYKQMQTEVGAVEAEIKQDAVDKAVSMQEIEETYLKNLKKYVNGDMSYTPEQKAQVEQYMGPIADMINKNADTLLSKVGDDTQFLSKYLDDMAAEIDKTGFTVGDALKAASLQIDKTGETLLGTLQKVNASTQAKFKFQQDLLFEEIDTKAAQQAAMLGLPPGSQSEMFQKAKQKQDVLTSLTLQMNEQELQGQLGIDQYVGEGKQKISLAQVALAESQGQKKESLAGGRFNFLAGQKGKEENILSEQGNALLALEQMKQNTLQNLAYGGLPGLISAGAQGLGFGQQMQANDQNLFSSILSPVTTQLGVEQMRQSQESTTTQKQDSGFLSSLASIIGAGAGAAGTVMSGMGAMGGGGGGGASVAGMAAAPMAPIRFNFGPSGSPTGGANLGNYGYNLGLG